MYMLHLMTGLEKAIPCTVGVGIVLLILPWKYDLPNDLDLRMTMGWSLIMVNLLGYRT